MGKQFKAWKWKMDKETFLHKKNRQADKDLSLTVREKYQLRCEHCDKINDIVIFPEHTCMECGFHFPIHKGDCSISYISLTYFCQMMSDGSTEEEGDE